MKITGIIVDIKNNDVVYIEEDVKDEVYREWVENNNYIISYNTFRDMVEKEKQEILENLALDSLRRKGKI